MERDLIYLDNAATGFPKPREVIDEMRHFMLNFGGNPSRGAHPLSLAAAEAVFDCRMRLCKMFGVDEPEQVIFTLNTTYALNMCIKGLLRKGDHVLLSDMEHNAVLRPIYKLASEGVITFDIFPTMIGDPNRNPWRICAGIAKRIHPNTRLLICGGIPNICSAQVPLREIGQFCRRHGILFAVDGAQACGHMKISLSDMCIDALALPAHKGLLGPQGCGALLLGSNLVLQTLIEGGSGMASLEPDMPSVSPERYESGTLPVPAIVGFSKALQIFDEIGEEAVTKHERCLFRMAKEQLSSINGVKIYVPEHEGAVLLFNIDGIGSEQVAEQLAERGICTRAGYHCNALGHKTLGTEQSGAVRVSFGVFNGSSDIDALACELQKIVSLR